MKGNLIACLYVVVVIIAAHLLCKWVFKDQKHVIHKFMLGWIALNVMLFMTPSAPLYFIGSGVLLSVMAPRSADDKLQFFVAMLVAIPYSSIWRVSLPGVASLLDLNHVKILAIALLLPIYFTKASSDSMPRPLTTADAKSRALFGFFFVFILFTILLDFRDRNLTSSFRIILGAYLDLLIILLVLFKVCTSREIVDKILFAILVSGVTLALLSTVEAFKSWGFYSVIGAVFTVEGMDQVGAFTARRGGTIRTTATMTPISLGFYLSICLMLSFYFSGLKKRGNTKYGGSIIISLILIIGFIFPGSRGAWLVAGLMIGLVMLMSKRFKYLRGVAALIFLVLIFSFPSLVNYLVANDPYGTFQYRVDLFNNSIAAIKDNILIGSRNFVEHPALQASRQGQGIIDIVNSYIGIALKYGVPLLVLLLTIVFSVVLKLTKLRKWSENSQEAVLLEWQLRTIIVLIMGVFTMIITVSLIDRIPHYLWMMLVLGMCAYRYGYRERQVQLDANL